MAEDIVHVLCPGGAVEIVDLALNPVIAKRIADGELSIVEPPKAAAKAAGKKAAAKADAEA